jgi:hypothetical protein
MPWSPVSRLKRHRAVAARYDKLAVHYEATMPRRSTAALMRR